MSIKLGSFNIEVRDDMAVCARCGEPLKNLKIASNETGTFYCDDKCCKEHIDDLKHCDECGCECIACRCTTFSGCDSCGCGK